MKTIFSSDDTGQDTVEGSLAEFTQGKLIQEYFRKIRDGTFTQADGVSAETASGYVEAMSELLASQSTTRTRLGDSTPSRSGEDCRQSSVRKRPRSAVTPPAQRKRAERGATTAEVHPAGDGAAPSKANSGLYDYDEENDTQFPREVTHTDSGSVHPSNLRSARLEIPESAADTASQDTQTPQASVASLAPEGQSRHATSVPNAGIKGAEDPDEQWFADFVDGDSYIA
ncbi:hypothetical protein QFC21_006112 [Naganishia friedmannii]|uniref:Uncharacterized protein n=1 Tax=Naganishia friedmannii TaxID=89922 RepID=A0ACC2V6L2_9TREE|nr:hypothetical protein QFC21_006112 [Naganishia friedmannii]